MEQHPIPQQISSYEFKLVGEMTLKQFLKATAGIVIALIINSTKIIFIIKWPLILLFGGGGLLLAFVPFEDRPLEVWAMAFLKSIYSPTIYLYKKRANKNWLDVDLTKVIEEPEENEEMVTKKDTVKVNEFIQSLPLVKKSFVQKEEILEKPVAKPEEKKEVEQIVTLPKNEAEEEIKEDVLWKNKKADLNLQTTKLNATGQAVFGAIPMPDIPEIPNVVVGMVTDQDGKIIEGAIIEIQDQAGNPVRVLKTNSLGQFKTLTQLINGKYLIITEKEGKIFDRVNVELRGQIIQPIKIKAID